MNEKQVLKGFVAGTALLAAAFLTPAAALAHCDGMDGPVVKAAQKALADGNVNRVLIWVQPEDEGAMKSAFRKTLAVRKLGPEAQELADMYFFETLVRIHRAGEGAPYTGLKPAGRDLGPVIPTADKAIADGKVEPLLKLLPAAAHARVRKHFNEVLARKNFKVDDVPAGRAYVEAYVTFMHAAEGVHEGGHEDSADHHQRGKAPRRQNSQSHQNKLPADGAPPTPDCPPADAKEVHHEAHEHPGQ